MFQNTFLLWLIFIFGLINFVHIGLYISSANIYDILQMRRKTKAKRNPAAAAAFQPRVTVLIPAHNEELGIIRTLETVSKSTYPNVSVIVIDDASGDMTSDLVREFINQHSHRISARFVVKDGKTVREYFRANTHIPPICLLTRPVNSGKASGLNYALKHAVDGGLVMTLDADSVLDAHAIENAVAYFRDPKVAGVAANVKIMPERTILGMLQKFEHMIGYRSKKFYSLAKCEFVIGGVASTYRYDVLKEVGFYDTNTATEDIGLSMKIASQGNREHRLVYGADIVASTEGVQSLTALLKQRYRWKMGTLQMLFKYRFLLANPSRKYTRSLTMYRVPMAFFSEVMLVFQPLMLSYVIAYAIMHHTLGVVAGGYTTVTLYILWSLWPDEHHTLKDKLTLSLYAPIMYFVFFIMDFVQVTAIIRCLINFKQFIHLPQHHVTWVSPERRVNTATLSRA
jgi:poly-beta-1,6-N-acetyl-D-glucosamine synthase